MMHVGRCQPAAVACKRRDASIRNNRGRISAVRQVRVYTPRGRNTPGYSEQVVLARLTSAARIAPFRSGDERDGRIASLVRV